MQKGRASQLALAVLVLALVTLAVTWPALLHLTDHTIGDNDFPGLKGEIFLQQLTVAELAEGRPFQVLESAPVNHPFGEDIRSHIGLSANLLLVAPVVALLPPLAAHNIVVMLILLANGLAMFALCRDHVKGLLVPLVAGAWMVADPYVLLKLAQGFPQKGMVFTIPLFWLALSRAFRDGGARHGLWAGLALALTAAIYPPYAVYGALALLIAAGLHLWHGRDPVATAIWSGLTMLPLIPVACLTSAMVSKETPAFTAAPHDILEGRLDLLHPFRHSLYPDAVFELARQVPFGLPPLVILLAGLATAGLLFRLRPRHASTAPGSVTAERALWWLLAVSTLCFLALALGDRAASGGRLIELGGRNLPLPHAILSGLPFGHRLAFPIRAIPFALVPATLLACLFLGDVMAKLEPRPITRRVLLGAALLAGPMAIRATLPELLPLPVRPLPYGELVRSLDGGEGAVLFIPLQPPERHKYLYPFIGALTDRPVSNYLNQHPDMTTLASAPCPWDGAEAACSHLRELSRGGIQTVVYLRDLAGESRQCLPGWLPMLGEGQEITEPPATLFQLPSQPPARCHPPGAALITHAGPERTPG